jgi:hypothetical protein
MRLFDHLRGKTVVMEVGGWTGIVKFIRSHHVGFGVPPMIEVQSISGVTAWMRYDCVTCLRETVSADYTEDRGLCFVSLAGMLYDDRESGESEPPDEGERYRIEVPTS